MLSLSSATLLLVMAAVLIYLGIGAYVAEPVTEIGKFLFTGNGNMHVKTNTFALVVMLIWPLAIVLAWTSPDIYKEKDDDNS